MTDSTEIVKIGKYKIALSHQDKLFWPEEGITKGMLLHYYQSAAAYILPFLKGRPQSLLRQPDGITGKSFYHKDAGEDVPKFVNTFSIPSASSDKIIDFIICNNAATLAYLNNLGCIELNPWHSTIQYPDFPDYMIIDIDPAEEGKFDQVVEVTLVLGELLKRAGIDSVCKTSGASGMHIYVPAGKRYTYEELRRFAKELCLLTHDILPHLTTMERSLKKRDGKIYLDYLQNSKGQTIASVFSVRPRKGAPVSMPLAWKEVRPGCSPHFFNMFNALESMERRAELFSRVLGKPALLELSRLKKS